MSALETSLLAYVVLSFVTMAIMLNRIIKLNDELDDKQAELEQDISERQRRMLQVQELAQREKVSASIIKQQKDEFHKDLDRIGQQNHTLHKIIEEKSDEIAILFDSIAAKDAKLEDAAKKIQQLSGFIARTHDCVASAVSSLGVLCDHICSLDLPDDEQDTVLSQSHVELPASPPEVPDDF